MALRDDVSREGEGTPAPSAGQGLTRHTQHLLYGWLLGWIVAGATVVTAVVVWWPSLLTAALTIAILGIGAVAALVMERLDADQREAVRALIALALRNYFFALFFIAFPACVYTAIRAISSVEANVPRVLGLSVCALLLVGALIVMHDEWFRSYAAHRRWIFSLWVYAATVVTSAAALFAAVTWELYQAGVLGLTPRPPNAGSLVDFYMYYLFNTAPGHITETLRWEPPFAYTESGTGVLVLLFTLAVAAPVIAFVIDQWRRRRALLSQRDRTGRVARRPWWAPRSLWSRMPHEM